MNIYTLLFKSTGHFYGLQILRPQQQHLCEGRLGLPQPDTACSNWIQLDPTAHCKAQLNHGRGCPAGSSRFQPVPTACCRAQLSPIHKVGAALGKTFKNWKNHQMTERSSKKKKTNERNNFGNTEMGEGTGEYGPCAGGEIALQPMGTTWYRRCFPAACGNTHTKAGKMYDKSFLLAINVIVPTLSLFCLW